MINGIRVEQLKSIMKVQVVLAKNKVPVHMLVIIAIEFDSYEFPVIF